MCLRCWKWSSKNRISNCRKRFRFSRISSGSNRGKISRSSRLNLKKKTSNGKNSKTIKRKVIPSINFLSLNLFSTERRTTRLITSEKTLKDLDKQEKEEKLRKVKEEVEEYERIFAKLKTDTKMENIDDIVNIYNTYEETNQNLYN